jgi:hypothetical protein
MNESLSELLRHEAFKPFRIVLTNGVGYDVRNPDLVVVQQSQLVYFYPKSDRFSILRLNQVASLDLLEAAA